MSIKAYFSPKSLEDMLIITLDITETAAKNDSISVEEAIAEFKQLFKDRKIDEIQWQHDIDKKNQTRYYFDITDESWDNISQILDKIKTSFKNEPYKQAVMGLNKTSTISYLPTETDVEFAESQLRKSPEEVIEIGAVLEQVESNLKSDGKLLKANWRYITERNIEIWFGKKK